MPTLGWPARTTRMPSRSSAPWRARSEHRVDAGRRALRAGPRASALTEEVDLLLGEVERRLDQQAQLDQRRGERVDLARERAVERARRRARRRLGAGVDQVGDGLGLGEVELVVEEGALGELARGRRCAGAAAARGRSLHRVSARRLRGSARAAAAARPGRRAPAARARLRRCTSAAPGRRSPGPGRSARPRRRGTARRSPGAAPAPGRRSRRPAARATRPRRGRCRPRRARSPSRSATIGSSWRASGSIGILRRRSGGATCRARPAAC